MKGFIGGSKPDQRWARAYIFALYTHSDDDDHDHEGQTKTCPVRVKQAHAAGPLLLTASFPKVLYREFTVQKQWFGLTPYGFSVAGVFAIVLRVPWYLFGLEGKPQGTNTFVR